MRTLILAAALTGTALGQSTVGERYEQKRAAREERDRTTWAREREAVEHEQYFVALWDDLRAAGDPYAVLKQLVLGDVTIAPPAILHLQRDGSWDEPQVLGPQRSMDLDQFHKMLDGFAGAGYVLDQCEWRHENYTPAGTGRPALSELSMVLHVRNPAEESRHQVRGRVEIQWSDVADDEGHAVPNLVDVTELEILESMGPAVFQERFSVSLEHGSPMDDVLVHDLNGDGRSDIAYPSSNQAFINQGDFRFGEAPLCGDAPKVVFEGVFADFTGDGFEDYLCAGVTPLRFTPETRMRLFLYPGDGSGRFNSTPRRLGAAELTFLRPDCFAVGDVDGDGDLDLWLTQYLAPYLDGRFPKPYYDAKDGLPSYLLLNDGTGDLTDATEASGLAGKRHRRTSRSSLVDLDGDGDLDLVVVSDFAGIDVHLNDGGGRFTDATASLLDEPSSFGMSHTFGDFNTDGRLDIYVGGVDSATARRLERMGLGREDMPEYDAMRERFAYGSRMYLGSDGTFAQPAFTDVARCGWAWGCASLDFDLDGDPDLYVANGDQSGRSVQDYSTRFWCHDIYAGSSEPDAALARVFSDELLLLSGGAVSWHGYEHNRLLMNRGREGFRNVAYLLGVALEADCRATVADDFDLDGRPDLLVVAYDRRYRYPKRVVKLLQNTWSQPRNWIGLRFRGAPGVSPLGAGVVVVHESGRQAEAVVTGDSTRSQHALLRHFGLGADDGVEYVEVRWPNGAVQRLDSPAINQYHDVSPPPKGDD